MKNRKGFTLIELLVVIIILGILMTLAITSMSGYIRKAKKDTFVTTAQQYANAARLGVVNGEYDNPGVNQCVVIKTKGIALESGTTKSSFDAEFNENLSYIVVKNVLNGTDEKYEYYIQMVDNNKNGFVLVEENSLTGDLVKEKVIEPTAADAANKATEVTTSTTSINVGGSACTVIAVK